jgi:hypothetical protein
MSDDAINNSVYIFSSEWVMLNNELERMWKELD